MTRPLAVYAHSFGLGSGSSNPSVLGFVPLLAAAEDMLAYNFSVSGAEAGDLATSAMSAVTAATDTSILLLGVNDQRHWGTNAVNLDVFKSTLLAEALKLATLDADFIKPSSALVTYTGFTGTPAAFSSRWTDTSGEHADFTVTGNSIYVVTIQQQGCAGQESITIDGVSMGTFNVSPASPITTGLGLSYMPKAYHFNVGGAITDTHTVRITKANASGTGNRIYFCGAWANGMASGPGPALYIGGCTAFTPAGYTAAGGSLAATIAYNEASKWVAETLAADGLNVKFVGLFWALNPSIHTDSGGCHPNDAGHWQIAEKFSEAMH